MVVLFFFHTEDDIRVHAYSRRRGDVYERQTLSGVIARRRLIRAVQKLRVGKGEGAKGASHAWHTGLGSGLAHGWGLPGRVATLSGVITRRRLIRAFLKM